MARPASVNPTDLELTILKILWEQAPRPVRDVREALAERGRDVAHTSVITTLNTMVRKKLLKRSRDGKQYLFAPQVEQRSVCLSMLGDVVERVFDGSAKAVVLSLFDHTDVEHDELKELRRLIDGKIKERGSK